MIRVSDEITRLSKRRIIDLSNKSLAEAAGESGRSRGGRRAARNVVAVPTLAVRPR
jgi:hypothetical protein